MRKRNTAQQMNVTNEIARAIGQAIGHAMTATAKHPPTSLEASAATQGELNELYEHFLATPEPNGLHIMKAAVVTGVQEGIRDACFSAHAHVLFPLSAPGNIP